MLPSFVAPEPGCVVTGPRPQPDDELQLADYARILRRRWHWVAGATAAVTVVALLVTVVQRDAYEATARVSLGNSAAQDAIQDPLFSNARTADRELSNEVNVAHSDAVRLDVETRLGLEPDIDISADDESDSLRFRATAAEASDAAVHANTWAEVYVEFKRQEAAASISEAIAVFETDLTELRAERTRLRGPIDDLQDRLLNAPPEQQPLLQVELDRVTAATAADFELIDAKVQGLAGNITQLELNRRLASTGTARVVQAAAPPLAPTNGSLARNLVLALFVGAMAGVAAAILVESLDRTIKDTEDVADFGIPVLGVIPDPGRTIPEDELPLATMRHVGTPVAEGYQKVRTALEFALLGRSITSLLITSPNQSEGKTTLSVNLAWAMSAVDHRVALVDVDFRRPRIHEVFDCPVQPGLSDRLLSETPLHHLAFRVDAKGNSNLIVIPTGTTPPSPADFVATPGFSGLIGELSEQADLVVLDAPPVLPVSDAPSIGRQVDAVVVAVKVGSTSRDQLADTLADLRGVGADVIGLCLVGHPGSSLYERYGPDAPPTEARRRLRLPALPERTRPETIDLRQEPSESTDLSPAGRSSVGYGLETDGAGPEPGLPGERRILASEPTPESTPEGPKA